MKWEKITRKPARLLPMASHNPRPCLADGKPAVFLRWIEEDRPLLKFNAFVSEDDRRQVYRRFYADGIVPAGGFVEVLHEVFALVEYQDGYVGKVKPELIRFVVEEG
jgi:hypothetical protein